MEDPQFFAQIPQNRGNGGRLHDQDPLLLSGYADRGRQFLGAAPSPPDRASLGSTAPIAGWTAARDCHDHGVRDARLRHRGVQQREHRHPGEYPWSRHAGRNHALPATGRHGAQPLHAEINRDRRGHPRDIFGFPARLADLQWDDHDTWLACRVNAGDRHLLTLEGIRPSGRSAHRRLHMQPITARQDRLVRCDLTIEILEGAVSMEPGTAKVAFGDHPLVDDLRTLELGRLAAYQYAPRARAILGPPLESWPATTV